MPIDQVSAGSGHPLGLGNFGGTGLTEAQVNAAGGLGGYSRFAQPLRNASGQVPFGTVFRRLMEGMESTNKGGSGTVLDQGRHNPPPWPRPGDDGTVITDSQNPPPGLPTLPSMAPRGGAGGSGGAGGAPKFNLTFSGPLDGQGTGPFGGSGQSPLGFLGGLFGGGGGSVGGTPPSGSGGGQSGIVEPTQFPNPPTWPQPQVNPNIPPGFRQTYRQPPNILDALRQLMMRGR